MSQALYRKYRPQKFSDLVGQKHIIKTLQNALKSDRISHAYLFTGPRGTGKTTVARIFSTAVNCKKLKNGEPCLECENCKNILNSRSIDIIEIDAASNTGVENIRDIKETVVLPPTFGKYKVYIIDEVHMLSQGAFNALLKTLEEPPKHVIFILATTEIHKIPETILSRCQRFDFTKMSLENIIEKLSTIAKSESVDISPESLELIAISAEGGMRDAESLLGQIMSLEDKNITTKEVEEILGVSDHTAIETATEFIAARDISSIFNLMNNLSKEGYDMEVFSKSLLNYLRKIMILKLSEEKEIFGSLELTQEQLQKALNISKNLELGFIIKIIDNLVEAKEKIRSSFIPQLPLEIAFVKSMENLAITSSAPTKEPGTFSSPSVPSPIEKTPIKRKTETVSAKNNVEEKKVSAEEKKPEPIIDPTPTIEPTTENTSSVEEIIPETQVESAATVSIDDVQSRWQKVREEVGKKNLSLSSFLSTCHPLRIEDRNTVIISTKYEFHKEKLAEINNRLTIEQILGNILGSSVKIGFVVEKRTEVASPAPIQDNRGENDQLVNSALSIFGGTLVE